MGNACAGDACCRGRQERDLPFCVRRYCGQRLDSSSCLSAATGPCRCKSEFCQSGRNDWRDAKAHCAVPWCAAVRGLYTASLTLSAPDGDAAGSCSTVHARSLAGRSESACSAPHAVSASRGDHAESDCWILRGSAAERGAAYTVDLACAGSGEQAARYRSDERSAASLRFHAASAGGRASVQRAGSRVWLKDSVRSAAGARLHAAGCHSWHSAGPSGQGAGGYLGDASRSFSNRSATLPAYTARLWARATAPAWRPATVQPVSDSGGSLRSAGGKQRRSIVTAHVRSAASGACASAAAAGARLEHRSAG